MSALGGRALRPYLRDGAGRARRGPGGTGAFGPAALLLPALAGKARHASPSSRGQDAALSRRKRGFNSPWGRQRIRKFQRFSPSMSGDCPEMAALLTGVVMPRRRTRAAHRIAERTSANAQTPNRSGRSLLEPGTRRSSSSSRGRGSVSADQRDAGERLERDFRIAGGQLSSISALRSSIARGQLSS
jgi:hypothetical protein